jgi:hypothetical protein
MARRSRYLSEIEAGRLDHAGEILSADDAPLTIDQPPPSPYGDQSAPLRNRAGDIVREVIPQTVWTQDEILAHFRAVGLVRDSASRTRAVGMRHSRSLRRVFE